jgi:hypothetical protein
MMFYIIDHGKEIGRKMSGIVQKSGYSQFRVLKWAFRKSAIEKKVKVV